MDASPTVIEPTTSSNSPLPKIPYLSPQPSSSSDSFDSSRPSSQPSSTTSQSVSPSPIPKSVPAIDTHECIELPVLPSNPSLPNNTSAGQSQRQTEPVQPDSALNTRTNNEASWHPRLGYLIRTGNWLTNTLGALNLALTLVGMIVFGRITMLAARNDLIGTCSQWASDGGNIGPNCKQILRSNDTDVIMPTWKFWKRTWNESSDPGFLRRYYGTTERSTLPASGLGGEPVNSKILDFSSVAILLASTIIVGGLTLIVFRRYWRTEEVFTSPVRSDWQFTRHHQEGPETVSGEGYRMIRRNPEDGHPLGQLREHIRSSQPNAVENPTGEPMWRSHNHSEETLVGPWRDTKWSTSKVSLMNDQSDETHGNLIELETEGPNKTFFDPETGEFIHLTPWKSAGDDEVHGLRPDSKGSIKRAFAQMTLGATGWAGGKNIDDQLAEELQANSKSAEKESDELKAGDGITGDLINEYPSGKPTMDPVYPVNEQDTGEIDPKVTEFLLHKPWYAGTKRDAGQDTEADTNHDGAEAAGKLGSVTTPNNEQGGAMFWIPQATPDGQLHYFNTLTGGSASEIPMIAKDQTADWEKIAVDSSHFPYTDREDTEESEAFVSKFARTTNYELGDDNISVCTKPNSEEQWQAILAATQLYSGRTSKWRSLRYFNRLFGLWKSKRTAIKSTAI